MKRLVGLSGSVAVACLLAACTNDSVEERVATTAFSDTAVSAPPDSEEGTVVGEICFDEQGNEVADASEAFECQPVVELEPLDTLAPAVPERVLTDLPGYEIVEAKSYAVPAPASPCCALARGVYETPAGRVRVDLYNPGDVADPRTEPYVVDVNGPREVIVPEENAVMTLTSLNAPTDDELLALADSLHVSGVGAARTITFDGGTTIGYLDAGDHGLVADGVMTEYWLTDGTQQWVMTAFTHELTTAPMTVDFYYQMGPARHVEVAGVDAMLSDGFQWRNVPGGEPAVLLWVDGNEYHRASLLSTDPAFLEAVVTGLRNEG